MDGADGEVPEKSLENEAISGFPVLGRITAEASLAGIAIAAALVQQAGEHGERLLLI
jgi:hypothetical protein